MRVISLVECCIAAHLSSRVNGPYNERGGLIFVAPPGQWKSTVIEIATEHYSDAILLSDINVQTLNAMHDELGQKINTLAFPAFEKIYERNPQTSSNIEGHIKALVAEGLSLASFEDQRMPGSYKARSLVIGGIPPVVHRQRFAAWRDNGFYRRFIWSFFHFKDPQVIIDAIHDWKKIDLEFDVPVVPSKKLEVDITEQESIKLFRMLRYQSGEAIPLVLLKKMFCVLKWRHKKDPSQAMKIIEDFATSLGKSPAELTI
jgi:hypothetical protein